MNKNKIFILIMMFALIIGCPSNPDAKKSVDNNGSTENNGGNGGSENVTGNEGIDSSQIKSLQILLDNDNIKDGDTINLAAYPSIDKFEANITKAVTINGGDKLQDMRGELLTVKKDGVTLSNMTNVDVTAHANLGSGSLKISGSSLNNLNLNGGGANSIHLFGVQVKNAVANKENVRLHIQDTATKIKSLVAKQNCKIEDDMTSDNTGSDTKFYPIEQLTVKKGAITEVKTAVETLDVSGDGAEVLLSRANSYIGEFVSSVNSAYLQNFRLTSIEKVNVSAILNSLSKITVSDVSSIDSIRKKMQHKTSDCLVFGSENSSSYSDVSYNFDGFVKAWKHFNDNSTDNNEKRIWSNYQNVRVLDKYKGKKITELAPKAFQMCQWLTTIDIGENVNVIGNLAFLGCSNLRSLYMRPINPPAVDGSRLFVKKGEKLTDETKLDRRLFDPTSDFISAECIDYFIEWYKGSPYAGEAGQKIIDDMNTAMGLISEMYGEKYGITSLGHFLKSDFMRTHEFIFDGLTAQAGVNVDLKPSVIVDKIMEEWDKTINQTDMSLITIYVPKGSLSKYQQADVWKRYADRMVETEDFSAIVHAE